MKLPAGCQWGLWQAAGTDFSSMCWEGCQVWGPQRGMGRAGNGWIWEAWISSRGGGELEQILGNWLRLLLLGLYPHDSSPLFSIAALLPPPLLPDEHGGGVSPLLVDFRPVCPPLAPQYGVRGAPQLSCALGFGFHNGSGWRW